MNSWRRKSKRKKKMKRRRKRRIWKREGIVGGGERVRMREGRKKFPAKKVLELCRYHLLVFTYIYK